MTDPYGINERTVVDALRQLGGSALLSQLEKRLNHGKEMQEVTQLGRLVDTLNLMKREGVIDEERLPSCHRTVDEEWKYTLIKRSQVRRVQDA